MQRLRPWLALCVLLATTVVAQEPQPLTNDDVIGLVKAGLSPTVIAAKIAGSQCRFDGSGPEFVGSPVFTRPSAAAPEQYSSWS